MIWVRTWLHLREKLILAQCGHVGTLNPRTLNHSIKMNQTRRKKKAFWDKKKKKERKKERKKKELWKYYDQTPFINAWPSSSHFILTEPLPVCSTCFYSRGPLATPPWPDGDHRQLHNEDCVRSLNDRPVYTSYKDTLPPPSLCLTHTHTNAHTNNWTT